MSAWASRQQASAVAAAPYGAGGHLALYRAWGPPRASPGKNPTLGTPWKGQGTLCRRLGRERPSSPAPPVSLLDSDAHSGALHHSSDCFQLSQGTEMLKQRREFTGSPGKNCSMAGDQEADELLGCGAQSRRFGRHLHCLG